MPRRQRVHAGRGCSKDLRASRRTQVTPKHALAVKQAQEAGSHFLETDARDLYQDAKNGSEGLGRRRTQRECGGEEQKGVRSVGLQRNHGKSPLGCRVLDNW